MFSIGGKKLDPREQARQWRKELRSQQRGLERQIREIEREQNRIERQIQQLHKKGQLDSVRVLAREIVNSRKAITKLYEARAHINSIHMQLESHYTMARVSEHLKSSTEVMQSMNRLISLPQLNQTIQSLSQEMMRAGVIEEMVNDHFEEIEEINEEEVEEEALKVLQEIGVEIGEMAPDAPSHRAGVKPSLTDEQLVAIAEGSTQNKEETKALFL